MLIRFLISLIVLWGLAPAGTALAAVMPATQAIETVKEDRKKETPVFACKQSEPSLFLSRRGGGSGPLCQAPEDQDFPYFYTSITGSRLTVHCSWSAITTMYARLLSVFNFPQRISLYPRHVYW
ncbi:MAG: hypothetical protein EOP56_12990 [Sphingobacteriales bacterium]|nr:MAG: hypothetical protein EOP56_12990 [Sphingobacteriales bacterium]